MLPRLLCEQLCSLNPDTPRLTFSVIWRLNELGDVIDEWFGRSVIRSVAKLSYAHAQSFIDEPDRCFGVDELPPIAHRFSVDDVKRSVLALHKVGLTNVPCNISHQIYVQIPVMVIGLFRVNIVPQYRTYYLRRTLL